MGKIKKLFKLASNGELAEESFPKAFEIEVTDCFIVIFHSEVSEH
jgi:hypothetical protein